MRAAGCREVTLRIDDLSRWSVVGEDYACGLRSGEVPIAAVKGHLEARELPFLTASRVSDASSTSTW